MDDATASIDLALQVAAYFGLDAGESRRIVAESVKSAARWRKEATALGLTAIECDRMASAFEHVDLDRARRSR